MGPQVTVKSPYEAAVTEFEAVRKRAMLQAVMARFTGRPVALFSYDEVARKLRVVGQAERGHRTIPTKAIVGSVGRYNDFTREFLPRMAQDAQRWARVKVAARSVSELPPIEVYQLGESYFVRDGNHRVSIARREGVDYLEAYVIEVRTRVPFEADDSPDGLIAKAEYADFLEYTKLDRLRPGANLLVSVPGQYERLENLIEVYRYFVEEAGERELSWAEAVGRWYDETYMPVVEVIREQAILRRFPNRTETDLFVWLAVHRAALEHTLNWPMGAEAAVTALTPEAGSLQPERRRGVGARLWRTLFGRMQRRSSVPALSWVDGKKLARYSDGLFGELLLLLEPGEAGRATMSSALLVAGREQASLRALHIGPEGKAPLELWTEIEMEAARRGVRASLATASESGVDDDARGLRLRGLRLPGLRLAERAVLVDLVVVSRSLAGEGEAVVADGFLSLLQAERPVLVGGLTASGPGQLVLDSMGRADDDGALFVATYLAERWQKPLTVLTDDRDYGKRERIRAYLTLHEVEARFGSEGSVGEAGRDSVIVLGVWERGWFGRRRVAQRVKDRLRSAPGALLFCP